MFSLDVSNHLVILWCQCLFCWVKYRQIDLLSAWGHFVTHTLFTSTVRWPKTDIPLSLIQPCQILKLLCETTIMTWMTQHRHHQFFSKLWNGSKRLENKNYLAGTTRVFISFNLGFGNIDAYFVLELPLFSVSKYVLDLLWLWLINLARFSR